MAPTNPSLSPFPVPFPATFSLDKQGVPLAGTAGKKGSTAIYVNAAFPHLTPSTSDLLDSNPRFPKTGYEIFNTGLKASASEPCLGRRPWDASKTAANGSKGDFADKYEYETYSQVAGRKDRIASALVGIWEQGLLGQGVPKTQWAIGIWCVNRPEWQHVSLAAGTQSLILTSLYDTLGPNVVEYCINHAECRVVFSTPNHIPALLELAGDKCPTMKVIISVDSLTEGRFAGQGEVLKKWGASKGVTIFGIDELELLGAKSPKPPTPPKRKDIASICYTSGTTGNPKGAVLTHEMLAAAAVGNLHGSAISKEGKKSLFMSYLPLSHIYERFCEDVVLAAGYPIAYSCGDNLRLLEDMQLAKPTFLVSVPRVLNRIYQQVKSNTVDAPGFKGKLTGKAFGDKLYNLKHHDTITHAFWDRIVFKKVRAALGGNVSFIGTGSAPIAPDVLDFLKVAFSSEVSEGYGQTEGMGTCVKCVQGDHHPNGTVGPPQVGLEVKLIDVPEMGYFSTDKPFPRGEILSRSLVVIPEYYKDPEKSKETVDEEGWLHSGDVGTVDEKGRFKIIDRIKNLVKLSQGEYVALEKIENTYTLCPLVAQMYIHADSLQDHVIALVVPDPEKFAPFASAQLGKAISATDGAAITAAAKDEKVNAALFKELSKYGERAKLAGFEKIKGIHIHLEPFSVENDLLTPTFKTKRNVAAKKFEKELAALYGKTSKLQSARAKL